MKQKTAIVIGAGFAGLSAASFLAKDGFKVTVLEKNSQAGGRARKFSEQGFTFDMGPSWYWMPDVFDTYFNSFGKKTSDYYELVRLSPSYRVFFGEHDLVDVPSDMNDLEKLFESLEKGSAKKLKQFINEAQYKYEVGINDLVYKPSQSILEFADSRIIKGVFKLHVFQSFSKYIRKYFQNEKIIQLLEFPVLFLGAQPKDIPALYSLMNYADMALGTWYPKGGMFKVVDGMLRVAEELGVEIRLNETVESIEVKTNNISAVKTNKAVYHADVVVGGADYHHIEQKLLKLEHRSYTEEYWESRTLAPSCLIYYLGIDKKLNNLLHHNLFFDKDFSKHAVEIYENPAWPSAPLFYVCCPSITDSTVAPEGKENLFILIPVAPGMKENPEIIELYFNMVMSRLEALTNQKIKEHVIVRRDYGYSNFVNDYNSYKGNAYGLANTLSQTAILKPSIKSKKIKNLYYTGQLTVPGPGVPPSLISGKVVATQIINDLNKTNGN